MVTITKMMLGAGLLAGSLALLAKLRAPEREPKREGPADPDVPAPKPSSTSPKPIHVAKRGDPQLEQLLVEFGGFLRGQGVDTDVVSPAELWVMPKTDGPAYAVPPRSMWGNIIGAAKLVMEIRAKLGFPLRLSAYRPADYNKAVGGAPKSQHVNFRAIDYRPAGEHNTSANRRKLALVSARLFLDRPKESIGLGLYSYPVPSNGHVDTGYARRTWEETGKYLAELAANA